MPSLTDRFRSVLSTSHQGLKDNVRDLTLQEALYAADGYRSILGVLKHIGGWAHVYRSYAFDAKPKHWEQTSWPGGLRDTVETSKNYVHEVIAWIDEAMRAWDTDLAELAPEAFDRPRPVHWGQEAPLAAIVTMVSNHLTYHTGELNMLLSIARGEGWEYGEEVEENHISTYGHGVRGPWMSDEIAATHVARLKAAYEARQASHR